MTDILAEEVYDVVLGSYGNVPGKFRQLSDVPALRLGNAKAMVLPTHAAETRGSGHNAQTTNNGRAPKAGSRAALVAK